jgi:hypothetical protein
VPELAIREHRERHEGRLVEVESAQVEGQAEFGDAESVRRTIRSKMSEIRSALS